ncbi:MAG: sensor histidine kinase [Ferruginibacter sp.]
MQTKTSETVLIILIGILLTLLLVSFIVAMLFLYRRNNLRHQKTMQLASAKFQQEILTAQLEIQEATFKNIAEEIHDNIGQTLSLAKFNIAVLPLDSGSALFEPITGTKELINTAIEDLRNLSHGLHSDRLMKMGIADAILNEAKHVNKSGKLKAVVEINGDSYPLPNGGEIILFRIFQESLNNIIKHAGASQISTSISFKPDAFVLNIKDDGRGFDVQELQQHGAGLGLTSMANRANLIGASFHINSNPEKGTEISVVLPKAKQQS